MATPVTFVVPGQRGIGVTRGEGAVRTPRIGRVKESVTVMARRAAGEAAVKMTAVPGEDVVVLHIGGGPELWLHPETAKDLLLAQQDPLAARGAGETPRADGEVAVPVRLQWRLEEAVPSRGAARGFLGDVLVKAVEVITGLAADKAADFAASAVVRKFDAQVDPGVYRLAERELTPLKGTDTSPIEPGAKPSLVLIHGTFSQTAGSFGKLWIEHPQLVRALFKKYDTRVYALDHPTLGASPIANAITLADAAPPGARLHLLTHSRGGLVAEVLARVCANPRDALTGLPAGDATSAAELTRLAEIVAAKRLAVDRVVRVACPARGTLLASKRLDAYISVVKWALELAQVPVAPELVEFLGEVARRRAEPETMPGLAAQIPDSPLIRWLHGFTTPIPGDLRVVAGDLEGDSVATWVKTLLSDAFYWTDNDLVVQTRSMYGGTPRRTDSVFLLDTGGKVSHFNYFSNAQTASAVVDALTADAPEGFQVIGPLSWSGTSSTGVRAAIVERRPEDAAALPALFLLPGILGSNLKVGDERIWLGWRLVNGFDRLAYTGNGGDAVKPDGLLDAYYEDLAAFLSETHDVRPFAFDWRRSITDEAKRLATEIDAALDARKATGQPVRILAHSMGGLVARALQFVNGNTWTRMMAHDGARILMLGTPNGGSWAPMQVLSGDDTFGNLLATVGMPFRSHEMREIIAGFPGLIQLQAGLLEELGVERTWADLANADLDAIRQRSIWHCLPLQLAEYEWGIPSQAVLDSAVALRREFDRQRDVDLPAFAHKLLLVVGKADLTPAKYQLTKDGVVYLNVPGHGDGRVTLASALLPGVATWVVDAEHGSLPRVKDAFEGYAELLQTARTNKLVPLSPTPAMRGADVAAAAPAPALVPGRPSRSFMDSAPPQRETEILTRAGQAPVRVSRSSGVGALRITVANGDLTYTPDPLLIGHYRASQLSGAEAVMDRAIGGAMSASLARGLYPTAPGTCHVFINTVQDPANPWQLPRPPAVIVAGLGAEGELRGTDLSMTVRQAVIAWAQRLTEGDPVPAVFSLATTLLGSGGSGITAGQAAQLIAQGVREANEQLARERAGVPRWPRVERITIVELYLDRASEAWNALQALASAAPSRFVVDPVIEPRIGALVRPRDAGYRGADYDFISALVASTSEGGQQILYTVNTRRARSDVRPQPTQVPLIRTLVSTASNNASADVQIGRTLFSLLVPPDLEPFLGSSTETVLELDEGTAGIPWELLETPTPSDGDGTPWSIRTKLLRKLRLSSPPFTAPDATAEDSILVIGDPACDRSKYPKLPGARREAETVVSCLMPALEPADNEAPATARVTSVISGLTAGEAEPDATAVINAVMARPWRIIHIAAHGEPPSDTSPDPRGVVLSGESFLGPREISALRVIPELVFVNCCYLATSRADLLGPTNYDRARFASGVAHALIKDGVRCVIAAGWAVNDEAASVFARTFYKKLLEGERFIDAVAAARSAARTCGGNTWAAYQCYGDPDWRFRRRSSDAQRPAVAVAPAGQEFASIASAEQLILALRAIAVESEFQRAKPEKQADRLRFLEATFSRYWQHRGDVAEAFGYAWSRAGFAPEAIQWYERARAAQDGTASLAAVEQLANVRIRAAWKRVEGKEAAPDDIDRARKEITDALGLLDTLSALGPTFERENLYGSTYKRIALLESAAGRDDAARDAIGRMRDHYAAAESIARSVPPGPERSRLPVFYPAMNRIAAQLVLGDPAERIDDKTIVEIRESMNAAPPDFWSVVGQTELDMYLSLSRGTLARDAAGLLKKFSDHHALVTAPWMWASVRDNAEFVLDAYRARASADEANAADRVLAHLNGLAGGPAPEKPVSATVSAPQAPQAAAQPLRARRTGAPSRSRSRGRSRGTTRRRR